MKESEKPITKKDLYIIYAIGLILHFGWYVNRDIRDNNNNKMNQTDINIEAFFTSIVWPVYWPLKISSAIFSIGKDTGR